jgi:hypothetical protein
MHSEAATSGQELPAIPYSDAAHCRRQHAGVDIKRDGTADVVAVLYTVSRMMKFSSKPLPVAMRPRSVELSSPPPSPGVVVPNRKLMSCSMSR